GSNDTSGDVQLFAQLAAEAVAQGFAALAFTAGKFPVAAENVIIFALADQNPLLADNDGNGGVNSLHSDQVFSRQSAEQQLHQILTRIASSSIKKVEQKRQQRPKKVRGVVSLTSYRYISYRGTDFVKPSPWLD